MEEPAKEINISLRLEEVQDILMSLDCRANIIETGSWLLSAANFRKLPEEVQNKLWVEEGVNIRDLDLDQLEKVVRLLKLELKFLDCVKILEDH